MLREGRTQFTVQTRNIYGQSLSRTVSTSAQRERGRAGNMYLLSAPHLIENAI